MTASLPTQADVFAARRAIAPHTRRTPLIRSDPLSARLGCEVHLKLETLQTTGSFKLRGATNHMLWLDETARRRGVVAVSSGNHARAVAYAAGRLGVPATIFMSSLVPAHKVEAVQALGADARIVGASQDEAEVEAHRLVEREGRPYLSPFDDALVIAGQGTIGLEILEEEPGLDTVLVPLSGGGLISGIALALKSANPGIRVVGITMERGAAMYASRRAGRPVEVVEERTLADSLGGGIGLENRFTFAMAQKHVDEMVLVSEAEIAEAMRWCYWQEEQIVEGGGAVGVAALLTGKVAPGARVVAVLSGRNVGMRAFTEIVTAEA